MAENNPNVTLRKKAYEPGSDSASGVITFDTNGKKIYLDGDVYGEQNVQADWNETGASSPSYILNKPTITQVGRVLCFGEYEPVLEYLYLEAVQAGSTVSMTSQLDTAPALEYSTDGKIWQEWQHTTAEGTHTFDTLTLTAVGDRVYFRGDNPNGMSTVGDEGEGLFISNFVLTGRLAGGGDVTSLLVRDGSVAEIPDYGLAALFSSMDASAVSEGLPFLTTAPLIGASSIGKDGCDSMYQGCTSLTAAADMANVTTIGEDGCYSMYRGCTSLTAAADMANVTTIGAYGCCSMYQDCASLTAAADMANVTTIGEGGCYYMYYGCTSLATAADMSNVTAIGDYGCYYMYSDCTFPMSDDGQTLNFDFPVPVTAGGTTYSTPIEVAQWMGNTNGFNA